MKLIQTVISAEGFREHASNASRFMLLDQLINLSMRESASLLIIPAGYLTAEAEHAVPTLINEMALRAREAKITIVGGVDVIGPVSKKSQTMEQLVQEVRVPYFGFAVGTAGLVADGGHPWRQTSINNTDAEFVPEVAVPGINRLVTVEGYRIGVLICGELFSRWARQNVGSAGASLLIDLGHSGMGQGLIPAMRSLATVGNCPVAHSHHLKSWYGKSLHFVNGQGEQESTVVDENHLLEQDALWAGWATRNI